ncbi:MAG: MFS transporter [Candidatus Saccharimonadales bacterium]|nr:MFS transporter [Candidatus Saccharimonadales bacterium]
MLDIIYSLFHHHKKWRDIKMSELSELYLSNTIKTLAVSLVGIFVPIYLLDLGYSLSEVAIFHVIFFGVRPSFDLLSGWLVVRYGPKHVMRLSYFVTTISMALLVTLGEINYPLWLVAVLWSFSWSSYWLAYHADFSKVKDEPTEGKEFGNMAIFVRLASAFGPLIGGLLAWVINVQFVFIVSVGMMFLAAVPLMLSPEPIKRRNNLSFERIPPKKIWRDLLSYWGAGFESITPTVIWPLYIAVAVFAFDDAVYAKVGFFSSLALVFGIVLLRYSGKLLDRHKGGMLFRYSTMASALTHGVRPLITNGLGVGVMSLIYEPFYNGFRLGLTKGIYDRADSFGKARVSYLAVMQTAIASAKLIFAVIFWILAVNYEPVKALQLALLVSALGTAISLVHRFPGLKDK